MTPRRTMVDDRVSSLMWLDPPSYYWKVIEPALYVTSKHLRPAGSMAHERREIWDYATIYFHPNRRPPIKVEDWLMMDGIER